MWGCLVTLNAALRHLSMEDGFCASANVAPWLSCPLETKGGRKACFHILPLKSMHLLDTGGSGLSNGTRETPLGLLEVIGYVLMYSSETALKTSVPVCKR